MIGENLLDKKPSARDTGNRARGPLKGMGTWAQELSTTRTSRDSRLATKTLALRQSETGESHQTAGETTS